MMQKIYIYIYIYTRVWVLGQYTCVCVYMYVENEGCVSDIQLYTSSQFMFSQCLYIPAACVLTIATKGYFLTISLSLTNSFSKLLAHTSMNVSGGKRERGREGERE